MQQFLYTFRYFCAPQDFLHFLLDRIRGTLSRYGQRPEGHEGTEGGGCRWATERGVTSDRRRRRPGTGGKVGVHWAVG